MEKKLTLREIAPYLPYGLEVIYTHTGERGNIKNLYDIEYYDDIKIGINWMDGEHIWMFKPILRPLSDLTKHECYTALSYNLRFNIDILGFPNYLDLKVNDYNILLENHFDVFGIIEKNLAIDINTLNK